MPPGTWPDDSPEAGLANTGDSYLDELRSGRVAGSEDWRRFSNAQLKAWQPFYVGNGKFKNKYGDIVDKPPDRGPNTPAGVNGLGEPGGYGGGGAGGAGGAGGGGGDMAGFQALMGSAGKGLESSTIWKAIQERLQGQSRYTPEVMAKLLSGVKSQAEQGATAGREALNASMVGRGLGRSTIAAGQEAAIAQRAGSEVLQADVANQRAKIDADFQDKSAAIEEGINWLNSLRSYVTSMYATKSQKDAAMANVQLGYAQIQASMDRLREQYAQDMTKIGLGL